MAGIIDSMKGKMSGMDDAMIQRFEMLKNKEQQGGLNSDERAEFDRLRSKMQSHTDSTPQ